MHNGFKRRTQEWKHLCHALPLTTKSVAKPSSEHALLLIWPVWKVQGLSKTKMEHVEMKDTTQHSN